MSWFSLFNKDLKRRIFEVNRQPTHSCKRVAFVLTAKITKLTRFNEKVKANVVIKYYEIIFNNFILRGDPKTFMNIELILIIYT